MRRVLLTAIVVLTVAAAVVSREGRPAAAATPITVGERGVTGSLPAGWQLAGESLTPQLTDPREVLSAGTFPLQHRPGACNHMPSGALRTMGPGDGFVTVLERGTDPDGLWTEFPARPARFARHAATEVRSEANDCLDETAHHLTYWMPYTGAGRHFYALVVLGRGAPDDVRTEAFGILDGLRFDPAAAPDWRASP